MEKRTFFAPAGFEPRTVQLVANRYTAYDIRVYTKTAF